MSLLCPNCGSPQENDGASFCAQCRFPLMKIAGKYRLQRLLAEGGQGSVYLAHHVALQRDPERVIKIVSPELFKRVPSMRQRFEREVQVTSALSQRCQHIVRIYDDFGEVPSLGFFYVMEYLEGEPLSALLTDSSQLPSLQRSAYIFGQLCDAMHWAHREQIVHRDLKPDNVMLIDYDEEKDFLKVLDFGIAKPTGGEEEKGTKLTKGAVGTPEYMAPEQLQGRDVDHRTDIYAMGIMLFEMLAGVPPFQVKGGGQGALFEMMARHLTEVPPKISEVRPDLAFPPTLEEIVAKALEKDPEARFSSVRAFKQAVAESVEGFVRDTSTLENLAPVRSRTLPSGDVMPSDVHLLEVDEAPVNEATRVSGDVAQRPQDASFTGLDVLDDLEPMRSSKAPWLIVLVLLLLAGGGAWAWLSKSGQPSVAKLPPEAVSRLKQAQERRRGATSPQHVAPAVKDAGEGVDARSTPSLMPETNTRVPAPRPRTTVVRRTRRRSVVKRRRRVSHRRIQPRRVRLVQQKLPSLRRQLALVRGATNPRLVKLKKPTPKLRTVTPRRVLRRCPGPRAGYAWIPVRLSPGRAKLFFVGGSGKMKKFRPSLRCLWFGGRSVTLQISKNGYRPCVLRVSPNIRRLTLRLDKTQEVELGGDDYCKR